MRPTRLSQDSHNHERLCGQHVSNRFCPGKMAPPESPAWLIHELVHSERGKKALEISALILMIFSCQRIATTQPNRSEEQERRRVAHPFQPLSGWMRWRHTDPTNIKRETNTERETGRAPPFQPHGLMQVLPSPGGAWKPRSTKLEAEMIFSKQFQPPSLPPFDLRLEPRPDTTSTPDAASRSFGPPRAATAPAPPAIPRRPPRARRRGCSTPAGAPQPAPPGWAPVSPAVRSVSPATGHEQRC